MIKRLYVLIVTLFIVQTHSAQDFSALWQGHFSYLNIKDIAQGNNKIYAAAENSVFTYDLTTNDISEISTINGLSGDPISNIHYSENSSLLMVGYETGLIDIIFDSDQDVLTVVDIVEKATIPPNNKRINHFNEFDGLVYIATDFGISVYDLARLEFGDTYFIGDLGTQKVINQTTVSGGFIYTASPTGLQKGEISNPNLIDYTQWQTINTSNWLAVESVGDNLYALQSNRQFFEIVNDTFNSVFTYTILPVDVKSIQDTLVITSPTDIFIYDSDFNLINSESINSNFNTVFTAGVISSDSTIYIGTVNNGVLLPDTSNALGFEEIHPDGPLLNNVFNLKAYPDDLWVTYGDYTIFFNAFPLRRRGFSQQTPDGWNNIAFDSSLGARNLNKIIKNPADPNKVYVSSFKDGILELENSVPNILYNQTNSGLESLILPGDPNFVGIRVSGLAFDFSDLIADPVDNLGLEDIIIDDFGTKWLGSYEVGVVAYSENGNLIRNLIDVSGEGNLSSPYVTALALDNRNQLWIGTFKGLRVFNNINGIFTDDDIETDPIIFLEDGVPKELLFQQYVSDIEVDGGNNKWLATIGSGLFLVSPDGRETIYHFTKDNSPLPSNNISDISIDESNGRLYIGTEKGLVSFNSGGSSPQDELVNAYVYPNPVRPSFDIIEDKVKIKDISNNVNIKITDIEGNLVAEAQSRTNSRFRGFNLEVEGGTAYWNGKNLANNVVSSGVYLVMLSDLDTFETKVLKLMVVR